MISPFLTLLTLKIFSLHIDHMQTDHFSHLQTQDIFTSIK